MLSVFPAKNEVRAMLSVVHLEEDRSWLLSPFNHLLKSTESCKLTHFSFPNADKKTTSPVSSELPELMSMHMTV